jgi:hypothetical protein
VRECLGAFGVATVLIVALWQATAVWPALGDSLPGLVAIVFLYLPARWVWRHGRGLDDYGLTARPLAKSLALGLGAPLVVFPLFTVGFVIFYQQVCSADGHALEVLAPPGMCRRFAGWDGFTHVRLPRELVLTVLTQLLVIALPEELFFRGYLLARLEVAFPPRRRWLGGGLGLALIAQAALFGLSHVLVGFDPRRMSVFFPALLFGWMRSATGSILAGVLCHALANVCIDTLTGTFFR